ncbi:hypothetical protein MMC27_003914 [Xylographa pallens]|nr:hypothetical protein [Xylographa pallens]
MSPFHRIIDDFMVQGGDITAGDGTGGQSIYDADFADENIGWREIDAAGLVCMANRGKGTNSSQGLDLVSRMGKLAVDGSDKPLEDVIITHCGELERRNQPPDAGPLESKRTGYNIHIESPERGRKRPIKSRSVSAAGSDPASENHVPRRKLRKRSTSSTHRIRRRSDVEIDETRRGRVLTSPLYSNKQDKTQNMSQNDRKRDMSPSRSRSRRLSSSPHLRRKHTRSRDRSLVSRGQALMYSRRQDEYDIRREEEEREGGSARFEGVIEDEHYMDRGSRRRNYNRHDRGLDSYKGGGARLGGAEAGNTGGEVKFKGRGSMKYKERKW